MAEQKRNMVLLTIDGLRPDHLSIYGYKRPTDQAIALFQKQMVVFKNAHTHSFPTIRAFPAIYASIWADECTTKFFWQHFKKLDLPKWCLTIAEAYQSHSYYCAAHTGWSNFLTPGQGFARGVSDFVGMLREDRLASKNFWEQIYSSAWQHLIYSFRYLPSSRLVDFIDWGFHWFRETVNTLLKTNLQSAGGVGGRSATAVSSYLLNRIDENHQKPFFLWGQFHDAHVPLAPPKEHAFHANVTPEEKKLIGSAIYHQTPLSEELREKLIDLYDGGIRTAFYEIGKVFDKLKSLNLLEHTCVIITSDHGCAFWEHGYWAYPENKFYDESTKVPLLMHCPERSNGPHFVDTPVSLMDLAPTMLELSHLSPEWRFFGSSFSEAATQSKNQIVRTEIWIETLGPPPHTCLVKDGAKIVYRNDRKEFVGTITQNSQMRPTSEKEKRCFHSLFGTYEKSKQNHTQKCNS